MKIKRTPLADCYLLIPKIRYDERGYFLERFNQLLFAKLTGENNYFVQDNESVSKYGVIRGLHAQKGTSAQAKIVSVVQGRVLDVVVDIRPGSKTYGKSFCMELSEENHYQLYIPKGFLHGFATLSETAKFIYKCDAFYNKGAEIGVRYDDPDLNIDWQLPEADRILSQKDLRLPPFKKLKL